MGRKYLAPNDWLDQEVPLGEGWLPFALVAVHEGRVPSEAPPFHQSGGDWTFFDARAGRDGSVPFVVGVRSPRPEELISWGEALLAVPGRQAANGLIQLFAHAFAAAPPAERQPTMPLRPLRSNTAVLAVGTANSRGPSPEGFDNTPNWTATKWFLEEDRHQAEVFVNYSVASRRGEFVEKDADYREPLIGALATALRDGPLPSRTPETDPNLTEAGPRVEGSRLLGREAVGQVVFSPDSRYLFYKDSHEVYSVDTAAGKPRMLAAFAGFVWHLAAVGAGIDLLVTEAISERERGYSSDDPRRVWRVDGRGRKTLLRGPEMGLHPPEASLSPEGRFLVLEAWRNPDAGSLRYTILYIFDLLSGEMRECERAGVSLDHVGWVGQGADLRAVVLSNRWGFEKRRPTASLIDPTTAASTRARGRGVYRAWSELRSPDGRYVATVDEDAFRLTVTDLSSGLRRKMTFHPEDRPCVHEECVSWAGSRYLAFQGGPRPALIDAATLLMNYPFPAGPPDAKDFVYSWSTDLRWVAYVRQTNRGNEFRLGRVEGVGGC